MHNMVTQPTIPAYVHNQPNETTRRKLDIYFHVFVNKYVRRFDNNPFTRKR